MFHGQDIHYSDTIILATIYTYDVTTYQLMGTRNSPHLARNSSIAIADTN